MTRTGRWLSALAVSSIALAAWALPRDRPSADLIARCTGSPAVESATTIELYKGSRLRDDGVLGGGTPRLCSESTEAARVTLAARAALALVPRELRPERVVVHLDPALPRGAPALGALETHAESASLFARSASASELEPSIWLHEFAHLRARGARPRDRAGRRIFAAIEEGVADYYAAVIRGSARLAASDAARDLERPPGVPPEYWVTLLAPSFDPHPFGWEFAAALWHVEKRPGPLLRDLIEGLSARMEAADLPAGDRTPARVAGSFVLRCPERSRRAIAGALERAFGLALEPERNDR